ncbi:flagellin N-terminal helical domain-containing protein [Paraclostridium sordellii]|uniref:flagellin N-terminal helical domain-containing protein n=1 Tax=Paraclostridium sordellii TaxID=1505 RepID=UPI0005E63C36|nr:flagellin [Paeniclostridium sordellii]MBX9181151.1 flagellin [Paeniclostridium sordellii]MBX9181153.1 flagellin [Paeniclostridium sordellii]CEP84917.1 flagellin C [[Clostridium] sordellii] [Paeniclostridium sordellii]
MRINTNLNAMVATNQMAKNTALSGKSMEKLSTGLRITKAGDDAAGLAVSEKMRSQIRGMEQADRNVQDGISMVQTAEGALQEAGNIAQRMRELGIQAGNDTLADTDRSKIKTELTQLQEEMTKIGEETKFNGKNLLSGTTSFTIQAGANQEIRKITTIDLVSQAKTLSKIEVGNASQAQSYVAEVDKTLEAINTGRATLGATQNRLECTSSNLTTSTENLSAAESRIRDIDVAKEMVKLSKLNILTQASQAMVAQAKQQPESVTQLLR